MRGDGAETTGELELAVIAVVGDGLDALHAAVTIGGAGEPPVTQLAHLDHRGPFAWTARATWRDRLVGLVDAGGVLIGATDDGALRLADGRRYPVPARRGLTAIAATGPGAVALCGPGALGQVRLRGGRIAAAFADDDESEPRAVAVGRSGQILAVGAAGAMWRADGDDWLAFEPGTDETLVGAAWIDEAGAIVLDDAGGVYLWDGQALRPRARGARRFTGLATWRGHAYLADGAAVWRLDGERLAAVRELPVERLAVAAGALFAFGGTLVARFDGDAWTGGPVHIP